MFNQDKKLRAIKAFLVISSLTFGLILFFGYMVHIIYPPYSLDNLVPLGLGCGLGNGLLHLIKELRNG